MSRGISLSRGDRPPPLGWRVIGVCLGGWAGVKGGVGDAAVVSRPGALHPTLRQKLLWLSAIPLSGIPLSHPLHPAGSSHNIQFCLHSTLPL
jgi:hypothetical protein